MDKNENINEIINNLKLNKKANKLYLDYLENIINKLKNFSEDCDECKSHLNIIESEMVENLKDIEKLDVKEYNEQLNIFSAHLRSKHKLITRGFFMSIFMPIGMCFGVLFGQLNDNIPIGISMGLGIGFIIGTLIDLALKKKDNVI